jgi:hypothetical protein
MNKNTNKNKNYIWSKIFKIDKKVMKMKGYEFKTIQTDGIGVSICFQKSGKNTDKIKVKIMKKNYI